MYVLPPHRHRPKLVLTGTSIPLFIKGTVECDSLEMYDPEAFLVCINWSRIIFMFSSPVWPANKELKSRSFVFRTLVALLERQVALAAFH